MNRNVMNSLVWAGLVLGSAVAFVELEKAGILPNGSDRGIGVIFGLVLAWCGNQLPKWGAGEACGSDGEAFRMRRFAGITFMLGGVGYGLAYLLAPIEQASTWAMVPAGAALVIVLGMALIKRRLV